MENKEMMCLICGARMRTQQENYQYTASGLPHVTLQSVEVSRCPNCGETEVAIPQIEALHRAIAKALIQKRTRLAPEEIRYLRTYLGWSGTDFAAHMGTTPETVSRWEHGATPIGKIADRLLRLLVATQTPVQDYSADLLAHIGDERNTPALRLGLRVEHEHWCEAALVPA
jgi:putative zinc finger/helix-turn-helix YgiT family protein